MGKPLPSKARLTVEESYRHCMKVAKQKARNFYYSFYGLPREKFRAMCVLYAFMRQTDDIADEESVSVEVRKQQLVAWNDELKSVFQGEVGYSDVMPAMAETIQKFDLKPEELFAVLEGVERDLESFEIRTFEQLKTYCYQVAGAVGLSCVRIWGCKKGSNEANVKTLSIHCGNALQLTNILRDLKEDAQNSRCYLPQEDLDRFGYSQDDLFQQLENDSFYQLMAFQLERAKREYRACVGLLDELNQEGRPVLLAMLRLYGGLFEQIETDPASVFRQRVSLPYWKKVQIGMTALFRIPCKPASWMQAVEETPFGNK